MPTTTRNRMAATLGRRFTFANVVSMIALFVALGGTSVAAVQLARNSVKGRHIAPNAVSSSDVRNRSLTARDFGRGELPQGPQTAAEGVVTLDSAADGNDLGGEPESWEVAVFNADRDNDNADTVTVRAEVLCASP